MSIFCRKHHKCKLPFIMRMESNSFSNFYLWTSSSSYYFLWKSLPIQTGLWLPICTPQAIILISWQKIYVKSDMANLHQVLTLEIQDGCCWPVTLCRSELNLIFFRIFAPYMSVQNLCFSDRKKRLCSETPYGFWFSLCSNSGRAGLRGKIWEETFFSFILICFNLTILIIVCSISKFLQFTIHRHIITG